MVAPLVAAKALGGAREMLSLPVIGRKTTTTYKKAGKVIVEETSIQLRAWEIALGGAVALVGAIALSTELGITPKEQGGRSVEDKLLLGLFFPPSLLRP